MDRRHLMLSAGAAVLAACSRKPVGPTSAPKITEGYADVPGGKVWWRKVGEGARTPLLTLHGGPGAAHNYLNPLEALSDQRPVILYDQLGCGKSDIPNDPSLWTIGRFCDEIDALRSALGLSEIVLLGHSWGGWLAIEYMTSRAAPKVEALILSSTSASTRQAAEGMRRLVNALPNGAGARIAALEKAGQTAGKEYQDLSNLFMSQHLFRGASMPPDGEASLAALNKSPVYPTMNGPSEWEIVGNLKAWDRSADLGKIKVPTLITQGEFDEVTPDCSETLHRGIAGSRVETIKAASHLYTLEQPVAYNRLVRDFLADKA
ncbi:MAG TPA: proline iminopeptidase-family hydrolase [Caulobacteraceae bacterium]|jgi:proline iminopeptidase|nr:proline iminopeptidase-family hydrolase [Caulobacteraceae bacterium]